MATIRRVANGLRQLLAKESDAENRSLERYRRAFRTSSGTYLARLVTVLTGLVTTPLLLRYLGDERYGLMVAAASLFFFFGYLDFGCGIGIQNLVSSAHGKGEHSKATVYVSTGFVFYLAVAFSLVVLSLCIIPHLPLKRILRVHGETGSAEILPTVLVLSVTASVGLISAYVQRLCDSLQQGYLTRLAMVFSRLLSFSLILLGIHFRAGLPVLVAFYILPSIASLSAYGVLLRRYPWMKPRLGAVDLSISGQILATGVQGLGAIVAYSAMIAAIPLVISNRIGAAFVVSFAIANQLVMLMADAIGSISTPFWPAITEATAAGDTRWVLMATKRFFTLSLSLVLFASLAFLLFGRSAIEIWTHNVAAVPSFSLLLSMSVYMVLLVVNANVCTVLNGLTRFRGQSIYGSLITVLAIALAFMGGPRLGVAGISWVFTAGFAIRCCCLLVELSVARRRWLMPPEPTTTRALRDASRSSAPLSGGCR